MTDNVLYDIDYLRSHIEHLEEQLTQFYRCRDAYKKSKKEFLPHVRDCIKYCKDALDKTENEIRKEEEQQEEDEESFPFIPKHFLHTPKPLAERLKEQEDNRGQLFSP